MEASEKYLTEHNGFLLLLLLFALSFHFPEAKSQEIPDSVVSERINYIQQSLDEGKPAANLWWKGWLYGYSAATVGQAIIWYKSDNLKTRQDMALGAASTLIGAAGQLLMPMTPVSASKQLRLLPGETAETRAIKLKKAEELFAASAKRELDGHSWKMHAVSGAFNLGGGLITWIGFNRTVWAGVEYFALNTAICEAQILTQPLRAARDYKQYCDEFNSGKPTAYHTDFHWMVSAYPGGITLRAVF
jgi:hypothetical protein